MSEAHILIIIAKNNLPIVEGSNTAADVLLEHFRISMSEAHILIIIAKNNLPIVEGSNTAADIIRT